MKICVYNEENDVAVDFVFLYCFNSKIKTNVINECMFLFTCRDYCITAPSSRSFLAMPILSIYISFVVSIHISTSSEYFCRFLRRDWHRIKWRQETDLFSLTACTVWLPWARTIHKHVQHFINHTCTTLEVYV
jgi:hypothetical protein